MTVDDLSENRPENREEDAAKELLLADLSHLQESFWKKVQWFASCGGEAQGFDPRC